MVPSTPWKVVSFDVGIKNMAYCVFKLRRTESDEVRCPKDITKDNEDILEIIDWNVIDLIDAPPQIHKTCEGILKNKKTCGKKAKFQSPVFNTTLETSPNLTPEKLEVGQCFCDKHAKESTMLLPTRERSPKHIKKLKIGELQTMVLQENIPETSMTDKRGILVEKITSYYARNCLIPLTYSTKRADDCSIISIGQRIKQTFNAIPAMNDVTHVLIENQISTIAPRMSIIQGLVTQYFIMKNEGDFVLEFISSKNKLKNFVGKTIPTKETTASQKYRQHKTDSIVYAKQLLEKYPEFQRWLPVLDTSKKDDLADCFLQGMWYLLESKTHDK